jgi:predicted nucleotidyltransferase
VLQAYLFGSYARGDADELSDLDLILVVDTDERFVQRAAAFDDLYEIGLALEIMVYTPAEFEAMRAEERPFLTSALEEGVPLL